MSDKIEAAWAAYKVSEEYAKAKEWAEYRGDMDAALRTAFVRGYEAAKPRPSS